MDLSGRVVLITGAAKRVGRATALRLASEGAHLALHFHQSKDAAEDTAEACRSLGAAAAVFTADLADIPQVERLTSDVLDAFGRIDVLINNASTFPTMRLDDFNIEAWDAALRVNLTAPMALTHACRDQLRANCGRVVNLLDASLSRPWPNHLAYMAAKGGLETLTKALARAFAPEVNVVGVAPGVAAWPDDYDAETRARLTARIPLRRAGEPNDIAAAIAYLLRDADYVTGTILPVDGGRHVV